MQTRSWWSFSLVVAIVALTATGANAQSSFPSQALNVTFAASAGTSANTAQGGDGGIGVGVLGGFTRPTLRGEDIDDLFETKNGFMVGLWVGGNRNGRVGFTGEFIYVFRKADTPLGELEYPAVEIPAVIHVNFGSRDREGVMGYALVGPVFTLNLQQKLNDVDVEDDEGFKGADIGVMVGGGIEFFRVGFEVRGNWGLRNINSEGDLVDIKTRAIEVLLKFRFN